MHIYCLQPFWGVDGANIAFNQLQEGSSSVVQAINFDPVFVARSYATNDLRLHCITSGYIRGR